MNKYAISVLTKRLEEHKKQLELLTNRQEDILDQMFIDNDIENHEYNINKLEKAITILIWNH